jgi:hypothetical protein
VWREQASKSILTIGTSIEYQQSTPNNSFMVVGRWSSTVGKESIHRARVRVRWREERSCLTWDWFLGRTAHSSGGSEKLKILSPVSQKNKQVTHLLRNANRTDTPTSVCRGLTRPPRCVKPKQATVVAFLKRHLLTFQS